jgi:MFS family permease
VSAVSSRGGEAALRRRLRGLSLTPPPAWLLTTAFAVAYVIVAPISSDLAAAGYRSELVSRAGLTLWDNGWYGGHHVLAYSVLAPALGAALSPQLLAGASAVVATALFAVLVQRRYAARAAYVATLWFALGASVTLLANRVPFELGLALALAALVAATLAVRAPPAAVGTTRARAAALGFALALAVLSALASPVAGAFLALAALAWVLAGDARGVGLALAGAALASVALLELAFPEGGTQPFVASAFYPALAAVLVLAVVLPARERVLRAGALLYALAMIGAYVVPSAVGGNADRLGSLLAGPLLACALLGDRADCGTAGPTSPRWAGSSRWPALPAGAWRTWALVALAPALLYWQVRAPVADFVSAAGDPAAKRSYYAPLLAELERLGIGYGARPARIEVVPSRDHAEARWVAGRVSIARGWERQLDTSRDALFYTGARRLSAARYGAWLRANAVSYVALADAPVDYSGRAEARLARERPPYLREIWRSSHWRVFAVTATQPLAQPPAALTRLGADSFTVRAPHAGSYVVRVRFTPYWALASEAGCVRRARGGWTTVQTRDAGAADVAIEFSLSRVFEHGPRCR